MGIELRGRVGEVLGAAEEGEDVDHGELPQEDAGDGFGSQTVREAEGELLKAGRASRRDAEAGREGRAGLPMQRSETAPARRHTAMQIGEATSSDRRREKMLSILSG